jgi:hypothetical protein
MSTADLTNAAWRKSSYSSANGECVEVAFIWRKSSYSGGNGNCVEVATADGLIAMRDSKTPTAPALLLTQGQFTAFLGALDGKLKRP